MNIKVFVRYLYVKIDISQFIIINKCFNYFFYTYNSWDFALRVTEFRLVHTRVREQIGLEFSVPSQG